MIISDIKYNEKNNLFKISIEEENFQVSYRVYEELQLKKDKELSMNEYNTILEESLFQDSKIIAERYLSYKQRTNKELVNRLSRDFKNPDVIDKVVKYYEKLLLLNDDKYAKEYLAYCLEVKRYSKSFTLSKFYQKGLDKSFFEQYIEDFNPEIDFENAKYLFEKRYGHKDLSDIKDKQKAFRYLQSKGFRYDDISRIIND